MSAAVTVLGGSTPFTAAFVEALRGAVQRLPPCELRLFGRDVEALSRMARYARARLGEHGWSASAHVALPEAVEGATVVVNQIRYGDLAGRARDEALAQRFGVPADETLGPCGLAGALRVVPHIRELGAALGRHCPDAWVLNLSNPLSVTTAALVRAGAPQKTVGLCELPLSTVQEACRVLGMAPSDVTWAYVGLNHRGFVTSLQHRREELLPRLAELLGEQTVHGIGAGEIRQTGALPLKYFRLMTAASAPAGRAGFLMALKEELSHELETSSAPPPSLTRRKLDWYEGAVVPMLEALFCEQDQTVVLDSLAEDGLVREHAALVSCRGFLPRPVPPPASVRPWLDRWAAHERAVLEAVACPTVERLAQALALDPTVPPAQVRAMALALRETA